MKKGIQKKLLKLSKNLIISMVLLSLIISNMSFTFAIFSTSTINVGKKGDTSRMPAEWVKHVEDFANSIIDYSQPERNHPQKADCSSFVCRMTQAYLGKEELPWPATTFSMPTDERFEEIDLKDIQPWDILWSTAAGTGYDHTEFYAGGGRTMGSVSSEGSETGKPFRIFKRRKTS